MAMNADEFLKAAMDSGIIAPEFLPSAFSASPAAVDVESLAGRLVEDGALTAFQAKEIGDGKAQQLVLGPYVLLDVLGKGGMGTVYEAEHRKMRRRVALKVMAETRLGSHDAVRRFEREVEAAARLEHHNIVTAHDAGEAEGTHYLVMQLVDGKSLAEIVTQSGRQPPRKVVAWMLQAADGLAYAHGRGVVHRDIKPGNLLLDRDGTVKILDMGLARLESLGTDQDQLTGVGQIIGTVDFMAPEQAMETRLADARSDIYSLGCTLWYLLTERPMFAGDSVVQRIMAHQQKPPPSLQEACPGIDPRLDAAFQRMVAKKPEDRFQSMQEVIAALEPLQYDEGSASSTARLVGRRTTEAGAGTATETHPHGSHAAGPQDTSPSSSVDGGPALDPVPAGRSPRNARPSWRAPALAVAVGAAILAIAGVVSVGGRQRRPVSPSPADRGPVATAAGQSAAGDAVASPAAQPAVAPFGAAEARAHQEAWAAQLGIPVESTNSFGMTLVVIPPGTFAMGQGTEAFDVTLTKPFLFGKTEVTMGQWREVMGGEPWQTGGIHPDFRIFVGEDDDMAATVMSWREAVTFCRRLTMHERASGRIRADQEYRLPTEAEWEYACRAGTQTLYSFGDDDSVLDDYSWYGAGWDEATKRPLPGGNTGEAQHTHGVGLKRPNPWGLHDVHGNATEWCRDRFAPLEQEPVTDPTGPEEGTLRVTRGGNWTSSPSELMSAVRQSKNEDFRGLGHGFRVVLTAARTGGRNPGSAEASVPPGEPSSATTVPPAAIAPFDATAAEAHQEAWADHLGIPVEWTNSLGMTLVVIPPGRFTLGGAGPKSVDVTLTNPFLIGQTEVTHGQWRTIMGTEPWAGNPWPDGREYVTEGNDVAATNISWDDACEFCSILTDRERAGGRIHPDQEYRLPTEAEWEYACRAGSSSRYSFGDDASLLGDHGWYGGGWDRVKRLPIPGGNTGDALYPHAVRLKAANPWRLYDMHGNVSEWCFDIMAELPGGTATDPTGPAAAAAQASTGPPRVARGGDWLSPPSGCRSTIRSPFAQSFRGGAVGFRVVLTSYATPRDHDEDRP